MREIQAPNVICDPYTYPKTVIFLAGSIEMGKAENWQSKVIKSFNESDKVTFLNPRRDDWDSSWKQDINDEQFSEQVNWELDGLTNSHLVIFYFDPNTQSPITLMELGYCLGLEIDVFVCCPEGFFRKGNVDIICQRHPYVATFAALDDMIKAVKDWL